MLAYFVPAYLRALYVSTSGLTSIAVECMFGICLPNNPQQQQDPMQSAFDGKTAGDTGVTLFVVSCSASESHSAINSSTEHVPARKRMS
jgi:hypothetical protein